MNSLPDRQRLLSLRQMRQQRAQRALHQTHQQLQPLLRELSAFDGQEASLRNLLASHRASDCTLDCRQLLALLRTQAVIRRQIDLLRLERDHVAGQCRQLEQLLHQQQQQLGDARRQYETCARSVQQMARTQWLERLRREERDSEEMMGAGR
ncbi:type III secretion protein [Pseudomonas sp. S2_C03]